MSSRPKIEHEWPWASAQYPDMVLKMARFIAASQGVSRSEVLRVALEEYIERNWTDELDAALDAAEAEEYVEKGVERPFRTR